MCLKRLYGGENPLSFSGGEHGVLTPLPVGGGRLPAGRQGMGVSTLKGRSVRVLKIID
jgi:hypothetical protein